MQRLILDKANYDQFQRNFLNNNVDLIILLNDSGSDFTFESICQDCYQSGIYLFLWLRSLMLSLIFICRLPIKPMRKTIWKQIVNTSTKSQLSYKKARMSASLITMAHQWEMVHVLAPGKAALLMTVTWFHC
jgi:hypothetical protein